MSNRRKTRNGQDRLRRARIVENPDGSATVVKVEHSGNLGCATEKLLDALKHQALAEQQLQDAVLHARLGHEWTWQQVADVVGITRQAVQKRYALAEQLTEAGMSAG